MLSNLFHISVIVAAGLLIPGMFFVGRGLLRIYRENSEEERVNASRFEFVAKMSPKEFQEAHLWAEKCGTPFRFIIDRRRLMVSAIDKLDDVV